MRSCNPQPPPSPPPNNPSPTIKPTAADRQGPPLRPAAPGQVQGTADGGEDERAVARDAAPDQGGRGRSRRARRAGPRQHDGGRRDQRHHQEGRSGAEGGAGQGRRRARGDRNEAKANQATVAECTAGRERVVAALDNKNVIDTFKRIAKVRGTAVARAEGERCTVCQVRLRPAVFAEVRRNDSIVQCDSCNRILYFIPPVKAPAHLCTRCTCRT